MEKEECVCVCVRAHACVCLYNQELGFVFIIFEMPVRLPEGTQRMQVNVLSLGIPVYG